MRSRRKKADDGAHQRTAEAHIPGMSAKRVASPSSINWGLSRVSLRFDLLLQDSKVISHVVHGGKNLARGPIDLVSNTENPVNPSRLEHIMSRHIIEIGTNLVPPKSSIENHEKSESHAARHQRYQSRVTIRD